MSNIPTISPVTPNSNFQPGASPASSLEAVLERIKKLANQTSGTSGLMSASPQTTPPPRATEQISEPEPDLDPEFPVDTESGNFRSTGDLNEPIVPIEPQSLRSAGIPESILEEIITRLLLARGELPGRTIADHVKLPFGLVDPILWRLKSSQLTVYSGTNAMNDYIHALTDAGRDRARRNMTKTTYYGSAPVPIEQYIAGIKLQTIESQHPSQAELQRAFADLLIPGNLLTRLGPAVNSGRGMFLYGNPGNGKTSIAERVTRSFGTYIWIPRALLVDGEIMRLFDPMNHQAAPPKAGEGLLVDSIIDRRWIRIRRPTIVVGGELTMSMLEIARNNDTNISEAPLQMKSNCGVLLIDDFGRQRIGVHELLNRWMIPLEQRHDYLSLQSGKRFRVPFDQLVIFSTNLQPRDLVDDAFLRRIPYKIEVGNPSEDDFRKLFKIMCETLSIPFDQEMLDYLIGRHYREAGREFRNCQPRDLLLQIRSFCLFNKSPQQMSRESIDFAVDNYFSIM
ncbi:MAG: AAA family ATPase [Planctomycetota bacterium]